MVNNFNFSSKNKIILTHYHSEMTTLCTCTQTRGKWYGNSGHKPLFSIFW